jgi:predicted CXXCH cytochrome family protein
MVTERRAGSQVPKSVRAARRRRLLEGTWYIFLSVAFLAVLMFGVASAAAVRPDFCGTCHESQQKSAEAAEHGSLSCDSCHAGSSVFGLVESRVSLVQMGLAQITPGTDALESRVSNETCRSCHEKDIAKTLTAKGLNMSHRAVVKENWSCTRCHATAGHGEGSSRLAGYNMDMCLQCHNTNPANRATCTVCHNEDGKSPPGAGKVAGGFVNRQTTTTTLPGGQEAAPAEGDEGEPENAETDGTEDATEGDGTEDATVTGAPDPAQAKADAAKLLRPKRPDRSYSTPWAVTHGPDAERTHGMGDLQTCKACHAQQYCVDCHKMELPHPPKFMGQHGGSVVRGELTREDCASCHEKSSCDSCHGLPMPHPGDFLKDHAQTTRDLGQQACFSCHREKTCQSCHIVHVHPGVPKDQLKALQNRPVR